MLREHRRWTKQNCSSSWVSWCGNMEKCRQQSRGQRRPFGWVTWAEEAIRVSLVGSGGRPGEPTKFQLVYLLDIKSVNRPNIYLFVWSSTKEVSSIYCQFTRTPNLEPCKTPSIPIQEHTHLPLSTCSSPSTNSPPSFQLLCISPSYRTVSQFWPATS